MPLSSSLAFGSFAACLTTSQPPSQFYCFSLICWTTSSLPKLPLVITTVFTLVLFHFKLAYLIAFMLGESNGQQTHVNYRYISTVILSRPPHWDLAIDPITSSSHPRSFLIKPALSIVIGHSSNRPTPLYPQTKRRKSAPCFVLSS